MVQLSGVSYEYFAWSLEQLKHVLWLAQSGAGVGRVETKIIVSDSQKGVIGDDGNFENCYSLARSCNGLQNTGCNSILQQKHK